MPMAMAKWSGCRAMSEALAQEVNHALQREWFAVRAAVCPCVAAPPVRQIGFGPDRRLPKVLEIALHRDDVVALSIDAVVMVSLEAEQGHVGLLLLQESRHDVQKGGRREQRHLP